jgi:hypothetical protein
MVTGTLIWAHPRLTSELPVTRQIRQSYRSALVRKTAFVRGVKPRLVGRDWCVLTCSIANIENESLLPGESRRGGSVWDATLVGKVNEKLHSASQLAGSPSRPYAEIITGALAYMAPEQTGRMQFRSQ